MLMTRICRGWADAAPLLLSAVESDHTKNARTRVPECKVPPTRFSCRLYIYSFHALRSSVSSVVVLASGLASIDPTSCFVDEMASVQVLLLSTQHLVLSCL